MIENNRKKKKKKGNYLFVNNVYWCIFKYKLINTL